jgi:hypothetical protein
VARVEWDQVGQRIFETGLDRGVFYKENGVGYVWNGLTGVDEQRSGSSVVSYYYDGVKTLDVVSIGDYAGRVDAITYPPEFEPFDGMVEADEGLIFDQQMPRTFDLTYRTLIGNDTEGLDHGYKIHILYNLTAVPTNKSHRSVGANVEPSSLSWDVSSVPVVVPGYYPVSHVIVDSRKVSPAALEAIENILYGSPGVTPAVPQPDQLFALMELDTYLIITDLGNGTWTASGPDSVVSMLNSTTFQIASAGAVFNDANSYNVTSQSA